MKSIVLFASWRGIRSILAPILVCVLPVLLQGCTTHSPRESPVSAGGSAGAGDALFIRGDVAGALAEWEKYRPASPAEALELALRQARAFRETGNARRALQAAETAVSEAQSIGDARKRVLAAIELGLAQIGVSRLVMARETLSKAGNLARDNQWWAELAQAETGLGLVERLESHPERALTHYAEAEALAERANDPVLAATLKVMRLQMTEDKPAARELWMAAEAQTRGLPDSARRSFLLLRLARIAQTQLAPEIDPAVTDALLQDAAASSRRWKDERLLSYALGYQGSALESRKRFAEAEGLTAQAADAAQRVGALESLYLWEWQAARLHQAQNRDEEALAAYRRAVFNLQQVRQDLAPGQFFREKVSPLFFGLSDLLLKKARVASDPGEAETLLREARSTLEQFKAAELQDYFQDRCVARFKEKSQGLEQVAAKTAVLYPILLPDRTEILAGFSDGLKQFVVPVGSERMNAEIHDFRFKLEKRTTFQYLKPARQLHQWLMAPLTEELQRRGVDTLVIVPDGALRTIPFAALHDGRHYLVEQFAVATTPGLSLTDPQPLPRENLDMLINGLTEAVQDFPALPNVERELSAIQAEQGGTLLKNDRFRLDAVGQEMENNPYRIIHIASHGQFDRDPKKTFLLTYDDKMTMDLLERYVSAGKFRDKPVELLTLSACQTAAGDDRAALGLAGVAIKAGARSALASLWFINDQASSDLVTQFYENLKNSVSKAEALRQAQRTLMNDPRYRHASYWAPFLMIGNWL
jgi:CHAT domain-containing protein